MTGSLTAAQAAFYAENGYLFPLPALSEAEVAEARAKLDATEAMVGGRLDGRNNQKPNLLFPWIDALIRHPRILDAVESVIGPNILCWGSQFFTKRAGDPAFVSWHQDGTYWGLSSADVVTAWVALTPSTPESGCMRVIAGTHTSQVPHTDTFADTNMLSRGQEIAVTVDENEATDLVLAPGQMSLHHVLIFHGSPPNRANHPRIGLAIRYVPTHVHQLDGGKGSATLVRGSDDTGHWEHEKAPLSDMHPDAVAHHAAVLDRQLATLYRGADGKGKLAATAM
ncbi:phytanoyl-CoA dioxygenase family protein [Elioraea rosea]|uniref:phytanoyl-CoA dioxygenase family protein n=1 Tax=Elioraea rosea TaxID=2492390 RepID=UPI0011837112|nr:phytanoyl-CoA dioxygenase family protein [Elioraea rosea]